MTHNEHIVIRSASPADDRALAVLAVLDGGQDRPKGRVAIAEAGGRLRAAVGVSGAAISDPFYPSAELVRMLRVHADALNERPAHTPRFALRRAQTLAA